MVPGRERPVVRHSPFPLNDWEEPSDKEIPISCSAKSASRNFKRVMQFEPLPLWFVPSRECNPARRTEHLDPAFCCA
jgi:hypothetical protein